MYCGHCGGQLQSGAQFCPKCGSRSQAQTAPTTTTTTQFGQFGGGQPQPQSFSSHSSHAPLENQQNGMALAGLILAFLSPFLGLIFSIIGLSKAKQMGGAGRGMAMAGLIISIFYIVVAVIFYIWYFQWFMDWLESFLDGLETYRKTL